MNKNLIVFMPSIEGGGVEKNLFLVCNYLIKKISDLKVITISSKHSNKFDRPIKIVTFKSKKWDRFGRKIKYFLALILLIKEIFKNKQVTVISFQANVYCILVCKIFSVKVIVRSNTAPIGWSKNIFKRIIFKLVLNLADKVIANSLEFKKNLKKDLNLDAICIYNPLDQNQIKKKSKIKSTKIFNSSRKLKILNIGRFTEQKDQLTFLKSLNFIKNKINFEARIIGRGELKSKLQKYIEINNLKKNVKIINYKNNPYPFIKQADLFVLSSRFEGLPNVILESLVLKKFVISSKCPTGPKEILLNGRGGLLFDVENYVGLASKIIYYNKNKKRCRLMLMKAHKALNRFNLELNLEKYLKVINFL